MNFLETHFSTTSPIRNCRRMMSCFQTSFVSLNGEQELDIRKYYHHDIGIVLSGSVEISRIDFNGRKSILEIIEKNEMFGRLYSYTPEENDTITAKCLKPAKIAFIPNEHIQRQCENACSCPYRADFESAGAHVQKNEHAERESEYSQPENDPRKTGQLFLPALRSYRHK